MYLHSSLDLVTPTTRRCMPKRSFKYELWIRNMKPGWSSLPRTGPMRRPTGPAIKPTMTPARPCVRDHWKATGHRKYLKRHDKTSKACTISTRHELRISTEQPSMVTFDLERDLPPQHMMHLFQMSNRHVGFHLVDERSPRMSHTRIPYTLHMAAYGP
jgi:hypothetical protein